jgi:DNA (cytosine-5)-methyltransferase 3A
MNVLSLFDGMSCGQIALNKAAIKYDKYFASEIDKYAIKVTQENFPNTIQLGDVTKIDFKSLSKIDLLIGGSPCQGFSFAGKQLNFNDSRSALFFEYVRLLKELKPKWFLLENVRMKKESEDVITKHLGVSPIEINSSLFSAQNRKRLYWTNISISPYKDKNILLADILETLSIGVIKDRGEWKERSDKSQCLDANYFKAPDNHGQRTMLFEKNRLSETCVSKFRKYGIKFLNECDPKAKVLTASDYLKLGKYGNYLESNDVPYIRKLTVMECKRLQTVPDDYLMNVSNSQAYKMLGNGWTVDVITHILGGLKNDYSI